MAMAEQSSPLLVWFLVLFAAIAVIILLIAGFILLIRRISSEHTEHNNRQKAVWNDTIQKLGLEFNPNTEGLLKPFAVAEGEYQDCKVKVAFLVVQSGEDSSDIYTFCEAFFPTSLDILLEIKSEQEIIQALKSVFEKDIVEIGLSVFKRSFMVKCPNDEKARQLLTSDLPGGESQNLAADLLMTKRFVEYIKVSDESVYLKNNGQLLELEEIKPILDSAVYLVKRIQMAREKLAKDLGKQSRLFP
jgi:hypothetical protein